MRSSSSSVGADAVSSFRIRDSWIKKQLEKRVDEFTEEMTLHVFAATWNVNAKQDVESLDEWLKPPTMESMPDVYAIGLQEIVDLNAVNLVANPKTADPWVHRFRSCLTDAYVHVCSKPLVGILLSVFVKKQHFSQVKEVMFDTAGVGVMGVGGNKGGVAIRFGLYDSTICIVNAHLAAHKNNVQGRNANFRDVAERIRFSLPADRGLTSRSFDIHCHDYLFWIGDLNYRLTLDDMDMVYERISAADWQYLLSHDQLLLERSAGNAFAGYREGKILFPPTYKYQRGTNKYERRPDKKQRLPAWCDRIMWTSRSSHMLMETKQLFYQRAELRMSDHKPVMSLFRIKVKVLVKEKQSAIYQDLIKQLDMWENEQMPKLSIAQSTLHFAGVRYDSPQTQSLELVNSGAVIAQFQFIPKLHDQEICQPWISVEPAFGMIPPNDKMMVEVTVRVGRESAFALNSGKETLEDILILRLENGRDYFLSISGEWMRTCLGSTLQYLVLVPDSVRTSGFDPLLHNSTGAMSVPKELWRMVDFIYLKGLSTKDIFFTSGDPVEVDSIVENLDLNAEFAAYSVHSMAEVLIRFLESMHSPIVPFELCSNLNCESISTLACQSILERLPQVHYNVFIFLNAFLREILHHTDENEVTAPALALVFAKAMTHADVCCQHPSQHPAAALLYHCLTSPEFV